MADPNDSSESAPEGAAPKSNVMSLPKALLDKMNSQSIPSTGPAQIPRFDVHTETRADVATEIRGLISKQTQPTVYRFADQPVQIVEAEVEAFLDEEDTIRATTARPVPLNEHSATGHIEGVARFFKQNADGPVSKPIPDWIRSLLIKTGVDQFPTLKGILRHPVVMDGKLVHGDKGYDRTSRFMIKASMAAKVRPEAMTDTPADLLKWLVEEWLGETSFDTYEDAVRALLIPATMLMTKTHLMAEGKFPGFLISAPDAGTGKSELAHALVEVVAGEDVGDTPWPEKDNTEMQKLVTSLVMADVDTIIWDNIPNGMNLKNSIFDQLLTSMVWSARILGQSQMVNAPCHAMNILTGNNIQPFSDTATRLLEVRLVLKDGKPPSYNRVSLRQWTKNNRASIIVALTRIITETPVADAGQIGRFPGWFRRIALPFMTLSGKHNLLDQWKETAPSWDAGALAEFLHALRKVSTDIHHGDGTAAVTVGQMLMKAPDETASLFNIDDEAMAPITRRLHPNPTPDEQHDHNKAHAKAVGKVGAMVAIRLRKFADRSADGMRLRVDKMKNDKGKTTSAIRVEMLE
jgi:hypothetical protein